MIGSREELREIINEYVERLESIKDANIENEEVSDFAQIGVDFLLEDSLDDWFLAEGNKINLLTKPIGIMIAYLATKGMLEYNDKGEALIKETGQIVLDEEYLFGKKKDN